MSDDWSRDHDSPASLRSPSNPGRRREEKPQADEINYERPRNPLHRNPALDRPRELELYHSKEGKHEMAKERPELLGERITVKD
eukprot:7166638-Karenia_brevis.AAC.1